MATTKELLKNTSLYGQSNFSEENSEFEFLRDDHVINGVASSVEIKKLSLRIINGDDIDLLDVYDGIFVQESLFTNFIYGSIKINDTAGGLEKFALRGGERLSIKICKPQTEDLIIWREDLYITKIGGGNVDSATNMTTYVLDFAPKSFINSMKRNLYKSYGNMSLADAVTSMYEEISPNDLFIEDPKITLSIPYISSGFMPHKSIDKLAQRSCTNDRSFVFFERFVPVFATGAVQSFSSTHYFGSIEKLIRDSEYAGIKTIHYIQKLDGIKETSLIRGINLRRKDNFNHMNAMNKGFYNTTITSINPIYRNHSVQNIGYTKENLFDRDFYENAFLDDKNIFNSYDNLIGEVPGQRVVYSGLNESVQKEQWLKNNIFGRFSKTYFQLTLDVEGGTNQIDVGHVVNFYMPSQMERTTNPQNPFPPADPIYSGKYLVTGTNHVIRNGRYIKSLELSRGSTPFNMNNTNLEFDILKFTDELVARMLTNQRS